MEIKILAVDDSLQQLKRLIESIDKYFNKLDDISYSVDRARKSVEALDMLYRNTYDVVFLDVDIDELSGVDIAKKIRMKNDNIEIIFVTAYPDFSIKAYEVFALNYLLKPIDDAIFKRTMSKAVENIRNKTIARKMEFLEVVMKTESHKLYYDDIMFFEKNGKYVKIYLADGVVIEPRATLNDFEEKVGNKYFLRCHRGYLVNIMKIEKYAYDELHLRNCEIPVPVGRKFKDRVDVTIRSMI
jgi:DNA-binding LytR/AlgR family response regulator